MLNILGQLLATSRSIFFLMVGKQEEDATTSIDSSNPKNVIDNVMKSMKAFS